MKRRWAMSHQRNGCKHVQYVSTNIFRYSFFVVVVVVRFFTEVRCCQCHAFHVILYWCNNTSCVYIRLRKRNRNRKAVSVCVVLFGVVVPYEIHLSVSKYEYGRLTKNISSWKHRETKKKKPKLKRTENETTKKNG